MDSWTAYLNPGYYGPMEQPTQPSQNITQYTTNMLGGIIGGMKNVGLNPIMNTNMIGNMMGSYVTAQTQEGYQKTLRRNNMDTNTTNILKGVLSALSFGLIHLI